MAHKQKIELELLLQIHKEYNSGISLSKLSEKYKISRHIIRNRISEIGVEIINRQNELRFDISKVISLYNQGMSLTKIAKQIGGTRNAMARHLKLAGFENENRHNKAKFNPNIFDNINSEEKAYWLGFIYADGNISSPRKNGKIQYQFELSLSAKDSQHLRKFNAFLNHESDIVKIRGNRCRLTVSNKHFWNTLNNYGCTPRKSLTLKFPNIEIFSDRYLVKDFIRGYIDGDGSIYYTDKRKMSTLSILGTENFLNGIKEFAPKMLLRKYKSNVYTLLLHSYSAVFTLQSIYFNSTIYLERKYLKVQLITENYESMQSYIRRRPTEMLEIDSRWL